MNSNTLEMMSLVVALVTLLVGEGVLLRRSALKKNPNSCVSAINFS
jgi:hypothetical protein